MLDIDFIEWRIRNGQPVAVEVMEVTRVDKGKKVNTGYLDAIISRYEERDFQAKAPRKVATALNTKAYIVLFREDCSEFWGYNLTNRQGWNYCSPEEMTDFLRKL